MDASAGRAADSRAHRSREQQSREAEEIANAADWRETETAEARSTAVCVHSLELGWSIAAPSAESAAEAASAAGMVKTLSDR